MFLGSVLQMPRVSRVYKLLPVSSSFQEDVFLLWMSTFRVMGKGDKPSTKLE